MSLFPRARLIIFEIIWRRCATTKVETSNPEVEADWLLLTVGVICRSISPCI